MQTFTHPVGDVHNYRVGPLRPSGDVGVLTADTTYSVDNPAIASINPNHGVSFVTVVQVTYLSPGTATITATGTNENGDTFSTTFQAIVTAVPSNATDRFTVTEMD